jgi:hypothetical protein
LAHPAQTIFFAPARGRPKILGSPGTYLICYHAIRKDPQGGNIMKNAMVIFSRAAPLAAGLALALAAAGSASRPAQNGQDHAGRVFLYDDSIQGADTSYQPFPGTGGAGPGLDTLYTPPLDTSLGYPDTSMGSPGVPGGGGSGTDTLNGAAPMNGGSSMNEAAPGVLQTQSAGAASSGYPASLASAPSMAGNVQSDSGSSSPYGGDEGMGGSADTGMGGSGNVPGDSLIPGSGDSTRANDSLGVPDWYEQG